ncbi:ABC-type transport auxiliary lipoprotein family protein [Desulfovibrio sp. OttesenSCG-928-F20]|nr:ABC-type transport auxiliary lipoprotein family protein [Desulfovibrio sp. OttesenSCG-928-F20]
MNAPACKKSVKSLAAALLLGCLTLACGACATMLDPGPPPARLQLHPALPKPQASPPVKKQLVVALPVTGRELDGDGITLIFNGREVRYLSGARWTGAVPHLLQRYFVEAFESARVLVGVSDDVTGIVANARLLTDVKMFGLSYPAEDAVPTACFSANFRLLDLYSGKMLDVRTIETRVPAGGKDYTALAQACEKALSAALEQLTAWTKETL